MVSLSHGFIDNTFIIGTVILWNKSKRIKTFTWNKFFPQKEKRNWQLIANHSLILWDYFNYSSCQ